VILRPPFTAWHSPNLKHAAAPPCRNGRLATASSRSGPSRPFAPFVPEPRRPCGALLLQAPAPRRISVFRRFTFKLSPVDVGAIAQAKVGNFLAMAAL
jgi:hypothetical protein